MDPRVVLAKLAAPSATAWKAFGAKAFFGEATFQTKNTLYRFVDGKFVSRTRRGIVETPASMRTVRLIGFLADEGGLWSLSARWREGALAVFYRGGPLDDARSFLLTSAVHRFDLVKKTVPLAAPEQSNVYRLSASRPPTLRRPAPPSMTRLHPPGTELPSRTP